MAIMGVILFVIGFLGRHFLNSRSFNRRNQMGVEEFKSYTSAAATHFIEKVGYVISGVVMIFGVVLLVTSFMIK